MAARAAAAADAARGHRGVAPSARSAASIAFTTRLSASTRRRASSNATLERWPSRPSASAAAWRTKRSSASSRGAIAPAAPASPPCPLARSTSDAIAAVRAGRLAVGARKPRSSSTTPGRSTRPSAVSAAARSTSVHESRRTTSRARASALSGATTASLTTAAAHRARRATLSAALLDASRDSDARVRQRAADALGAFAGAGDVAVRLRELARDDSSLFVRAAAIGSYAAVAPDSALAVARDLVRRDSWTDVERTAALAALGRVDRPGVVELLREYLAPSASRPARTAAIASLVAHATGGHEAETAATIAPLLDADDLFVRQAAADALGRLGQRASLPMLEARRRVEPESRVVNAIDAALRAIGAVGR